MRFAHGFTSINGRTAAMEYTALHCSNTYLKNMFFYQVNNSHKSQTNFSVRIQEYIHAY